MGKIIAVSISEKKGTKKKNVDSIELKENYGVVRDAHAEGGMRQVSLLANESIDKMRAKGLNVVPGNFAENITTEGINLTGLKVGSKIEIGKEVVLEVSQIGKDCRSRCHIYYEAGDCIMPKEGIFARIIKGGTVKPGDIISVGGDKNVQNRSTDNK